MDFLELLKGPTNRFDLGMSMRQSDLCALRDGIVYLLNRVAVLESRLSPVNEEVSHDGPLLTIPSEVSMKKRGRPAKS